MISQDIGIHKVTAIQLAPTMEDRIVFTTSSS